MSETIAVSKTLTVEVVSGTDAHVDVDRSAGGLVRVEPSELRGLVAGLVAAAGLLAAGEARRVVTAEPSAGCTADTPVSPQGGTDEHRH